MLRATCICLFKVYSVRVKAVVVLISEKEEEPRLVVARRGNTETTSIWGWMMVLERKAVFIVSLCRIRARGRKYADEVG